MSPHKQAALVESPPRETFRPRGREAFPREAAHEDAARRCDSSCAKTRPSLDDARVGQGGVVVGARSWVLSSGLPFAFRTSQKRNGGASSIQAPDANRKQHQAPVPAVGTHNAARNLIQPPLAPGPALHNPTTPIARGLLIALRVAQGQGRRSRGLYHKVPHPLRPSRRPPAPEALRPPDVRFRNRQGKRLENEAPR